MYEFVHIYWISDFSFEEIQMGAFFCIIDAIHFFLSSMQFGNSEVMTLAWWKKCMWYVIYLLFSLFFL
jgi:hypothetical protein